MEETLFDVSGSPTAYIARNDQNTIYLWNGTPVAYLDLNNLIYGFNGKHLGWFENGIVRNLSGEKNGYIKATLPRYASYEPYKSYKQYKPYKSYKSYANYKPYYSYNQSNKPLIQFLSAGR